MIYIAYGVVILIATVFVWFYWHVRKFYKEQENEKINYDVKK